jgi:hypothetical protein
VIVMIFCLQKIFQVLLPKVLATIDSGTRYLPNWHIDLIAEYLAAAERGEVTRLIINMPPRALKSICVSVAWPAWLLAHDPKRRILAASYASGIAIKHSIDCRQVLRTPWYQELFPQTRMTEDQDEKSKFMTSARGFRLATSVGGTLTGEGGNFLIMDDPISPSQAMNRKKRDVANKWFEHTFASRLDDKKRGVIILVMQRLHPEDLSGYLLEKGGWEQLSLPALNNEKQVYRYGSIRKIYAEGELLHADRENIALMEQAKQDLGSAAFCRAIYATTRAGRRAHGAKSLV